MRGGMGQRAGWLSLEFQDNTACGLIAPPVLQGCSPYLDTDPRSALLRRQQVSARTQLQESKNTSKTRQRALLLVIPCIFSSSLQTSRWFSLSSHEASEPARLADRVHRVVLPDFPYLQVTSDLQTLPPNRKLLSPPPRELFSIKQQLQNIYSNFLLLLFDDLPLSEQQEKKRETERNETA